jgi:hypothetical protein
MTGIVWNEGHPPETLRGKRLLLISSPMNMNFAAAADIEELIECLCFIHQLSPNTFKFVRDVLVGSIAR